MNIPDAAFDAMFDRLGHTLNEYDGLAEALYAHEQAKKKTAPARERPSFTFSVRMTLPPRCVLGQVCVGVVLRTPANRS